MGKAIRPERVLFARELPKTRSAKIMRRVVRATYLGRDPGDLSSLDNPGGVKAIADAQWEPPENRPVVVGGAAGAAHLAHAAGVGRPRQAPRRSARSTKSRATTSQSLDGARSVVAPGPCSVSRGTNAVRRPSPRAARRS